MARPQCWALENKKMRVVVIIIMQHMLRRFATVRMECEMHLFLTGVLLIRIITIQ